MSNIFDKESNNGVTQDVRQFGAGSMLWDEAAIRELNTYRNLNVFALECEPILNLIPGRSDDKCIPLKEPGKTFEGRHALFNHTMGVGNNLEYQKEMNAPLLDTPETRIKMRQKADCSVRALVLASERGEMGRAVYQYSDFMFCKHLGRISNNYLITLRRFPMPAGDHINYTINPDKEPNDHTPDMGRLVTWMGTPGNDMSSILKYDVNLPYEEFTSEIQTAQYNADNSGGFMGGMMNLASGAYKDGMLKAENGERSIEAIRTALSPISGSFASKLSAPSDPSWKYYQDKTKAYGPVDSISRTHYRASPEKGGIKFEHNITLTFDYELRSFDGINTRAAILDLLGNILVVTFTNAEYWRGIIRANGPAQSNIFANLPIFHMSAPVGVAGLTNAIFQSAKEIGAAFNNGNPINGLGDLMNAAKNLLRGVGTGITAGLLNAMGRPQKNALNSLLNFAPTGMWHLMIGNPRRPIMSMGNMILDNCSIEHYGPLGLDDFPTGLKVTITLKHGMPRDNLKIEQMYMNGDYRIYQPLGSIGLSSWRNAQELYQEDKRGTAADVADTEASTNPAINSDSTNDLQVSSNLTNKILIKHWGTIDNINIEKAVLEANRGSEDRTSDAEKAGEREAQAAQKKNNR